MNGESKPPLVWSIVESLVVTVLTIAALLGALVQIGWECIKGFFRDK